jgi:hypothetical protein
VVDDVAELDGVLNVQGGLLAFDPIGLDCHFAIGIPGHVLGIGHDGNGEGEECSLLERFEEVEVLGVLARFG